MISALLALIFSAAFTGAALYVNLVEQPARLALDDMSMVKNGRRATAAASPCSADWRWSPRSPPSSPSAGTAISAC